MPAPKASTVPIVLHIYYITRSFIVWDKGPEEHWNGEVEKNKDLVILVDKTTGSVLPNDPSIHNLKLLIFFHQIS